MRSRAAGAALLVVLAVLAAACGGGGTDPNEALLRDEEAGSGSPTTGDVFIPEGALRLHVTESEFAFRPERLDVQAGRPLAIVIENAGSEQHDWALRTEEGEAVWQTGILAPGEETTVVMNLFPGTYEMWCTIPGHLARGMRGEIVAR
jgi:uncharacterized cupredoxin-like copper-binding protein